MLFQLVKATDRNTGEPMLINMAHVIAAHSIANRPDHTEVLLAALDGTGRTRQLAIRETPAELHEQLLQQQTDQYKEIGFIAGMVIATLQKDEVAIECFKLDTPARHRR